MGTACAQHGMCELALVLRENVQLIYSHEIKGFISVTHCYVVSSRTKKNGMRRKNTKSSKIECQQV
jgi:hypothetical protein